MDQENLRRMAEFAKILIIMVPFAVALTGIGIALSGELFDKEGDDYKHP